MLCLHAQWRRLNQEERKLRKSSTYLISREFTDQPNEADGLDFDIMQDHPNQLARQKMYYNVTRLFREFETGSQWATGLLAT